MKTCFSPLPLILAVCWMVGTPVVSGQVWTVETRPAKKKHAAEEVATKEAKPVPSTNVEPALKPGEWQPFVEPEKQIFPSLLLASATLKDPLREEETAHKAETPANSRHVPPANHAATPVPMPEAFGDENGLLGVVLISPADGAHVRVEVEENALVNTSVIEADLPEKGHEYHLLPHVAYKYDALNRVRQSHPINVTFAVSVDGKSLGEQFVTARVHPINDCPYAYQNPDDPKDYVDIAWMFAAYVNEDHPAIPALLKEAQETGVVDGFDAYQSNDPGTVLLQVFAVWEALRQHNIHYSDIGTTTDESNSLYSLHVRFMEEALSESHANCVDASVLLASVLRRMGIDTFLVMEPGHMFLGVYLDRDGKQSACLETTMLGDPDPPKCVENRALAKSATPAVKKLKGWRCFNNALDVATHEFKKHRLKYEKENDPDYDVVDITAARREGVAPVGFVKAE